MHWVVYEPSYTNRWLDDSVITSAESKQSDGYWLHRIRKDAADSVKSKGATSYIHRIKMIAAKNGITYKGISTPKEFWDYLDTFPKDAISRVWYSGHASGKGLFLSLSHNSSCEAVANLSDIIQVTDISANSKLAY